MNPKFSQGIILVCLIVIVICGAIILVFFPDEFPGVIGTGIYIVFVGFVIGFFVQYIKRK